MTKEKPKTRTDSAERKKKALERLDVQIEKTGWDDAENDEDLNFADLEISFDEAIEKSMKTDGK